MNEEYVKKRLEQYTLSRHLYEEFAKQTLTILKSVINSKYPDLKIASCTFRAKEVESLRRKLLKDKYNIDSEITDLAGARIIVYSRRDIAVVSKLIEECFCIDEQNSIDKTRALGNDRVGYRGEHYIVSFDENRIRMPENRKFENLKCEIQVTTLIAHTWSEITHEKGYKFEGVLPNDLDRRKNLLAGMLELADMEMDAYVEAYDRYVEEIEQENEKGCLKYPINSMSLERFMEWKFPNVSPLVFRDMDSILKELTEYGLATIESLNQLISTSFEKEIHNAGWRSCDGIIRNILIINDPQKYFSDVWNSSMNQMNIKNFELYKKFGVNIEEICEEFDIDVV